MRKLLWSVTFLLCVVWGASAYTQTFSFPLANGNVVSGTVTIDSNDPTNSQIQFSSSSSSITVTSNEILSDKAGTTKKLLDWFLANFGEGLANQASVGANSVTRLTNGQTTVVARQLTAVAKASPEKLKDPAFVRQLGEKLGSASLGSSFGIDPKTPMATSASNLFSLPTKFEVKSDDVGNWNLASQSFVVGYKTLTSTEKYRAGTIYSLGTGIGSSNGGPGKETSSSSTTVLGSVGQNGKSAFDMLGFSVIFGGRSDWTLNDQWTVTPSAGLEFNGFFAELDRMFNPGNSGGSSPNAQMNLVIPFGIEGSFQLSPDLSFFGSIDSNLNCVRFGEYVPNYLAYLEGLGTLNIDISGTLNVPALDNFKIKLDVQVVAPLPNSLGATGATTVSPTIGLSF